MYSCKQGFSRACPIALSRLDQWRWMLCMAQAARRASRSRAGPQRERERETHPIFSRKTLGCLDGIQDFLAFGEVFTYPLFFFHSANFFMIPSFRETPRFSHSHSADLGGSPAFNTVIRQIFGHPGFFPRAPPGHLQGTLNYFEHLACT